MNDIIMNNLFNKSDMQCNIFSYLGIDIKTSYFYAEKFYEKLFLNNDNFNLNNNFLKKNDLKKNHDLKKNYDLKKNVIKLIVFKNTFTEICKKCNINSQSLIEILDYFVDEINRNFVFAKSKNERIGALFFGEQFTKLPVWKNYKKDSFRTFFPNYINDIKKEIYLAMHDKII